jgi:hypothetical protein
MDLVSAGGAMLHDVVNVAHLRYERYGGKESGEKVRRLTARLISQK